MLDKIHKILDLIIEKRYQFAGIFFAVSFSSFSILYATGLVPEVFMAPQNKVSAETSLENSGTSKSDVPETPEISAPAELPIHILIESIGVDSSISNPVSTDISVLNGALTEGVVRYPTSGKPGKGNMLLFGHSTSYKIVNNKAYQAFNGIQHLKKGDSIIVESRGFFHRYEVTSVELTTSNDAHVEFDTGKNMLTLSTCNVLGAKEERFVVEADFVESVPKSERQ